MLELVKERKLFFTTLLLVGLIIRLYCVAVFPHYGGDSPVYDALATNLIAARTFSISTAPPLLPTDMRTPGYPIFLAAIYFIFGHHASVVMIVQAVLDLFTCLLVAMIVFEIAAESVRRRAALIAFALAAVCPFLAEYAAAILTETLATFLTTLALLFSVYALKRGGQLYWWLSGAVGGLAILVRPDSGLLVAAIGITLLITLAWRRRFRQLLASGAVYGLAVLFVLSPWIGRNWIVLKKFQPLSTRYAEMPGEFVPLGYMRWVRTWIDNGKYVDPALWSLEEREIDFDLLPAKAFDSETERSRIRELIEAYNEDTTMTPELDSQFQAIAAERIARAPLRYYIWLPAKRAVSLWFDTRAELLPITGLIFPVREQIQNNPIDFTISLWQWLLNGCYVIAGLLGLYAMRREPVWAILFILIVGVRTLFFSGVENPESRYLLETYPLVEGFGAIGTIWLFDFENKPRRARRNTK